MYEFVHFLHISARFLVFAWRSHRQLGHPSRTGGNVSYERFKVCSWTFNPRLVLFTPLFICIFILWDLSSIQLDTFWFVFTNSQNWNQLSAYRNFLSKGALRGFWLLVYFLLRLTQHVASKVKLNANDLNDVGIEMELSAVTGQLLEWLELR